MAKVAKVRTRKRGKSWYYSFEIGYSDGSRRQREKGGYATKEEAYKAGTAAYTEYSHGNIGITSARIRMDKYLDIWLEDICRLSVRDTTYYQYKSQIKNHIKPTLGHYILQELKPVMVDQWIRRLAQDGLAHKSIALVLTILKHALKYAVHPGQLISVNPAEYIEVPRGAPQNLVERTIITQEHMQTILEACPPGHFAYIPIQILFHTGVRIGECLGLCWNDINLKADTIRIRRQIRYITDLHGHFFRRPKTQASLRTIRIGPTLAAILAEHRKSQLRAEAQTGGSYLYNYTSDDGRIVSQSKCIPIEGELKKESFVCTKPDGGFIAPDVLRWQLRQLGLNSHSFRHTQATLLIENGAPAKGVSARLGHASVNITQDIYAHDTQKLQDSAAELFESIISANDRRQNPYVDKPPAND